MVGSKTAGQSNYSPKFGKFAGIVQACGDLIARQVRKFTNDVPGPKAKQGRAENKIENRRGVNLSMNGRDDGTRTRGLCGDRCGPEASASAASSVILRAALS